MHLMITNLKTHKIAVASKDGSGGRGGGGGGDGDHVLKEWFSGGVANALTSALLNPLDVTKTLLQLQVSRNGTPPHSMLVTMGQVWSKQGMRGLWMPGLQASMVREMLNSGPRAGKIPF